MPQHKSVASASGKVILFGEHAVVYGRPAIAVPLQERRATATVEDALPGEGITLVATDLGRRYPLDTAPVDDPLALIVRTTLKALEVHPPPDLVVTIQSTITMASGLGSGAAVSAAVVRALAAHVARALTPEQTSQLVYQAEILHHGTPSGIDNTVVAFEQPVYFIKGRRAECLRMDHPLHLVIGETGIPSPTRLAVADVRRAWEADRGHYDRLFDEMGQIADGARQALESGAAIALGRLMDHNQALLREIGVSSPDLEELIRVAKEAGALGAKLSGAGRGGNMIALVSQDMAQGVADALRRAGAKDAIATHVKNR